MAHFEKSHSTRILTSGLLLLGLVGLEACGGSVATNDGSGPSADADVVDSSPVSSDAVSDAAVEDTFVSPVDTGAPTDSASAPETPSSCGADDAPTRRACTNNFGSALSTSHGRLDGTLVAVVPITAHGCNADNTHVHLQVLVNGAVYDVAVNVDGIMDELDAEIPDGAWSEGWHTSGTNLDYVSSLGLHSSSFSLTGTSAVATEIENQLASTNRISVFATGYGPTGAHLVHRQGGGRDGAIVVNPLACPSHLLVFRFSNQSF
jgi:hypothetical protein